MTRHRFAARGLLPCLAAALVCAMAAPAQAQDWPQHPVHVIGPYAPGGNADVLARLTAQRLSTAFGQQFIVENRVGGNGTIAAMAVKQSTPDGYTLMWGVLPPVAIQPSMQQVPYDSQKDFAPISAVATNEFVLVVNKNVPVHNVKEFIAWVKAQPNKVNYAEGAVGSITHLAMVLFAQRAGLQMTNISYRGNHPALTDVIANHVPTMFSDISDALPQIRAGNVRAIAVSSEKRLKQLPDVPTVAETFPGYTAVTWNGLMAPVNTPKPIIDKIAGDLARAGKDPTFVAALAKLGAEPLCNTPEEFAKLIDRDIKTWRGALTAAGLAKK